MFLLTSRIFEFDVRQIYETEQPRQVKETVRIPGRTRRGKKDDLRFPSTERSAHVQRLMFNIMFAFDARVC